MTERLGDELEPPMDPGKPEGVRVLVPLAVVAVLIIIAATVFAITHSADPLSPDEFCAGHGGVRYLDSGGGASATATCNDGHAGWVRR